MTNTTAEDIDKKLLETDFERPILELYKGFFTDCFIILHPFNKKVFANHYDEFRNFKLTYPLIEDITWAQILKDTGIKSIEKLALTITYPALSNNYQELVNTEWNEFYPFLKENHIIEPFWDNDKIPEEIILRFLEHLLAEGYSEIKAGHWSGFTDEQTELIALKEDTKFGNSVNLANRNFIYTIDRKYCLKLPYHDLPYSLLLTNEVKADDIVNKLNYEGFKAKKETKVYWYIQ